MKHAFKPKGPPPEPLPEPELRVRIVAPSAQGPWTLHIENEGTKPLRVPADIRLLHLTVESGDTMSKRGPKPVTCTLPAAMRPNGFPDRHALLLGPGDSYVESFEPRLFCFGSAAKLLVGGALVRARYGWEAPKNARTLPPPYVVEGTAFPATVEPKKDVVLPTMLLSYMPPEPEDVPEPAKPEGDEAAEKGDKADKADKDEKETAEEKHAEKAPAIVDENAARIEVTAPGFVDAPSGGKVAISLTATNVGHRPALAAVRNRMVAFRVDGPDGTIFCHATPQSGAIPRDGYHPIKPGGSTSLTVLVEESCGRDVFRRPGLYRVTPTLHLNESGNEIGLAAYTGEIRAKEPTLVRVAEGPDPFYKLLPKAIRAVPEPPNDGAASGPKPQAPAEP